jgi:hypothetical protein
MTSVTRELKGVKLQLYPDGEAMKLNRRIGSCTLRFQDGSRDYIRIYGVMDDIWTRDERVEFEKELRNICGEPDVIAELFPGKALQDVRRFNPSEYMISRGWRCHSNVIGATAILA